MDPFLVASSLGMPLKKLRKTAILCDGRTLVVLVASTPGGISSGNNPHSFFGEPPAAVSLRCKFTLSLDRCVINKDYAAKCRKLFGKIFG